MSSKEEDGQAVWCVMFAVVCTPWLRRSCFPAILQVLVVTACKQHVVSG